MGVIVGGSVAGIGTGCADKLIIGVVLIRGGMMVGVRHRLHIAHPIVAIGGSVVQGVGDYSGLVVIVVQVLGRVTVWVSHFGGLASEGVGVGGGFSHRMAGALEVSCSWL